jgi:hypothetical protein
MSVRLESRFLNTIFCLQASAHSLTGSVITWPMLVVPLLLPFRTFCREIFSFFFPFLLLYADDSIDPPSASFFYESYHVKSPLPYPTHQRVTPPDTISPSADSPVNQRQFTFLLSIYLGMIMNNWFSSLTLFGEERTMTECLDIHKILWCDTITWPI